MKLLSIVERQLKNSPSKMGLDIYNPDSLSADVKVLVIGRPGVGKTTSIKTIPKDHSKILYLTAEGGGSVLARTGIRGLETLKWSAFKHVIELLQEDVMDTECLVIDTFDEVQFLVERHIIENRSEEAKAKRGPTMTQDEWGIMRTMMKNLLADLRNLKLPVIVLMHEKTDKDEETGASEVGPAIQGSIKESIEGYFEFVLYAKAYKPKGKQVTEYSWLTKANQKYHAKDRTNLLPEVIKQDFGLVWEAKIKQLKGEHNEG